MLKAASTEIVVRCPVALHSDRFPEAPTVRCVLPDVHTGPCKTIDGYALTAEAVSPVARYEAMGLEAPPHVAAAQARFEAMWQAEVDAVMRRPPRAEDAPTWTPEPPTRREGPNRTGARDTWIATFVAVAVLVLAAVALVRALR